MRQRTVFTGVCLFTSGRGGTPIWLMGGTHFLGPGGGNTTFPGGGGGGYYLQAGGGVLPSQAGWGCCLPRQGGVLPSWRGGGTTSRQGGYPLPEQHSVYLLRGGRYASCVYAGGLSCNSSCVEIDKIH